MALRYCFEQDHVKATLARSKPSDLAVIDSDGISKAVIQAAVSRGVMVYDYINCGGARIRAPWKILLPNPKSRKEKMIYDVYDF